MGEAHGSKALADGSSRGEGLRLGYACVNTRFPSPARTVRLANATPERLREIAVANLDALQAILGWNAAYGIEVFRVTSNLIPFASHPVNRVRWWDELASRLARVGATGAQLSTHPGQYTVLGSEKPDVVAASVAELEYHDRLLSAFGLDSSHKIVVHLSGTASRFEAGFARLGEGARSRLVLENDERHPLAEVLPLAERLGLPVVFDVFHHELAPSFAGLGTRELVLLASETWTSRQKIHFSTQAPDKRPGAHAETIDLEAFAQLVDQVGDLPLDCMLEVKDKEQSVLRANELLPSATVRARPRRTALQAAL